MGRLGILKHQKLTPPAYRTPKNRPSGVRTLNSKSLTEALTGPLTAEIGSGVWGTPANVNGFRVLASLLQQRRSPEANQTLHDVYRLLGCYIHFCQVQSSCYVEVLRSPTLAALLHHTPAAGVSETLRHGARNGITELSQRASAKGYF